ncbi:hypothetical protein EH165_01790 [Nakamurella antarctica]|uniref:Uncharacterized protein n=1 Tax=Nakamurella antarctica TaxID=1902245 RepID=A0A3G8ZRA7_9ACTN|nr:hypothetical protein [Nakamurella antarctica]AZI57084.1 hypothetical protein EH165_01790 [Nakamurella antarctica]
MARAWGRTDAHGINGRRLGSSGAYAVVSFPSPAWRQYGQNLYAATGNTIVRGLPMQRLGAFLRTYWTRGLPGRPTPKSVDKLMLRWWLVALACKLLGSSWDVSWHFKWLRDDLAPPHLLNTVGTGIAIVLVLTYSITGYGVDKLSLRIIQWGTGIFLIAAPIDVINHRVNGLDLTAWSPSHAMLYFGTAVMIAGIIRLWYLRYPRENTASWAIGLTALFAFFFENAHFAQLQQEYGILEIASWFRGSAYAEGELLNFAAGQLGRPVDAISLEKFALPIPPWVYPIWALVVCVPILVLARHMVGKFWTATAITGGYVLYRAVTLPLLVAGSFPPSVPPVWLVGVGVLVDALFLVRAHAYLRAVLGGVLVTAGGYGALWLQNVVSGTPTDLAYKPIEQVEAAYAAGAGDPLRFPPVDYASLWWALPGAVATWLLITYAAQRWLGFGTPRPPAGAVKYAAEPARGKNGYLMGAPAALAGSHIPVKRPGRPVKQSAQPRAKSR